MIVVYYDDLIEAADLIENFQQYWNECENTGNPVEARKQLLAKIIDRVFVHENKVIAIALHGDYNVILDEETAISLEFAEQLRNETESKDGNIPKNVSVHVGSDGDRTRACTLLLVPEFLRTNASLTMLLPYRQWIKSKILYDVTPVSGFPRL